MFQTESPTNKKYDKLESVIELLKSVIIAVFVCLFIYIFIATPNQVEGQSMEPNFHEDDVILTSRIHQWLGETDLGKSLGLRYKLGDVIVFQKPGFDYFIKRVIGIPGDKILISGGKIIVNGEEIDETYLPTGTETRGGSLIQEGEQELTVPKNHYFVVGDNRNNSHDSRYLDIGFIDKDWILGKVILKYWPITDLELI